MHALIGRSLGPILTLLAVMPGAAPVMAEPLAAALARTYRGNPQLSAERARQRADDENVPTALSGYRPAITGQALFGPRYERERPGQGDALVAPLALGLSVDQMLYDSGRTAAAVRGAESAVLGGRAALRGVEQTVLLMAVTAYLDVLRDEQLVTLQLGNIEALTETLRIARKRFELGDTRRTDSAQAEGRLARGRADLAFARSNLQASVAAYRQAIGAPPRDLAFPAPPDRLLPRSLAAASARTRAEHPAVRAAMHAVDGAELGVKAAEADLGPQARLQGSLQGSIGRRLPSDQTPLYTFGVQANVPVYDGGVAAAAVRRAKETVGQRRMDLEAARLAVVADLRTAWANLEAARAAVPAAEAAIAANEIAVAGVRAEALEGQRTTIEVLNAQQELLGARSSLVVARRDLVVASYGTLSAAGMLTARRLGLAGRHYRPETHYDQVRDLKSGLQTPDGR